MMGREQAFIDVGTREHTCLKSSRLKSQNFSCSSVLRSTKQTNQSHVAAGATAHSTMGPRLSSHHQVRIGVVVSKNATFIMKDPLYYIACLSQLPTLEADDPQTRPAPCSSSKSVSNSKIRQLSPTAMPTSKQTMTTILIRIRSRPCSKSTKPGRHTNAMLNEVNAPL